MKVTIISGDLYPKRLGWRCEAVAFCPYIKGSEAPRQRFSAGVCTKDIDVSFERRLQTGAESNGISGYEYTYAVYEPQHEEKGLEYIKAIRKLVMQDGFQRMLNDQHNEASM